MHGIDLLIIVAYLAAVVAAGAWFGRRQNTTSRYFLAGGNVPWWAIAASIVATETSTITFISVPGIAFSRGGNFTFLQLVLGYLAGRVVICLLFIPSYFRGDLGVGREQTVVGGLLVIGDLHAPSAEPAQDQSIPAKFR